MHNKYKIKITYKIIMKCLLELVFSKLWTNSDCWETCWIESLSSSRKAASSIWHCEQGPLCLCAPTKFGEICIAHIVGFENSLLVNINAFQNTVQIALTFLFLKFWKPFVESHNSRNKILLKMIKCLSVDIDHSQIQNHRPQCESSVGWIVLSTVPQHHTQSTD